MTPEEFAQVQEVIWGVDGKNSPLCPAAYVCFQFVMIIRLDNTAKFRQPDLQPYSKYPDYAIMGHLPWSKNVNEKHDAPK